MRDQREMATVLIACVLLFAGATAAAAQTQNYPASPYFSPQTAPRAPSPYYGTNANQNRNRGYLNPNPYDPNSIYGAGAPYRPDKLRNPGPAASTADVADRNRRTHYVSASTRAVYIAITVSGLTAQWKQSL
jgi:hypothetical protein